jgi:hypothetical protein
MKKKEHNIRTFWKEQRNYEAFACTHPLKLSTMHKPFTVHTETFEMTLADNSA